MRLDGVNIPPLFQENEGDFYFGNSWLWDLIHIFNLQEERWDFTWTGERITTFTQGVTSYYLLRRVDLFQVLYEGDSRGHKSQNIVPLQSKLLPNFSSPFYDIKPYGLFGHRIRGDCSTELHRIANTHPTLTSPAMNCPNPGGKVTVAIRKVITPGYMRRLKRKKILLKYNLTSFSCSTITSGLWMLFLWKLSATSVSIALEFCYWQFSALLHWSSFIESSSVSKDIFPIRISVMGGMEGDTDVQNAQTWIHGGNVYLQWCVDLLSKASTSSICPDYASLASSSPMQCILS